MKNQKVPTWLGTVVIIIFAITVGMLTWKCENNKRLNQTQTGNSAVQNNNINKQAQKEQADTSQTENKSRLIGDGCYAIKDGRIDELHFRNDFNSDPANTTVHYENKDFGVSFDVPYNKKWGNENCKVSPYLEGSDLSMNTLEISFGLPRPWLGDSYRFSLGEKRSAEEILNKQKIVNGMPNPNPRMKKIGKHQSVVYESYGMGTSRIYEIPGIRNNYRFEHFQIGDKQKDISAYSYELESAIKTLIISEAK